MRTVILFGFLAFGCGGNEAAPNNPAVTDAGTNLDGHLDTTTGSGGGNGSTCSTACDCMPGSACQSGHCVMGTTKTYCCEASTCPGGSACQSMTGTFSTCTSPTTGSNGSNGGTNGGSSGGVIGGLTGGLGGIDLDGGLGGIIGGLSGGLGGGGDGGIIGGLTGGGGGGNPLCGFISCSADSDCTGLGCSMCGAGGKCM